MKRRHLTRLDLVQIVNRFLLIHAVGQPKLLSVKHWQRAAFIVRQNRLLPEPVVRALTKHGTTAVVDMALEAEALKLKAGAA